MGVGGSGAGRHRERGRGLGSPTGGRGLWSGGETRGSRREVAGGASRVPQSRGSGGGTRAPGGEPSGATVSACFRRARSTGRPAVSPGDVGPVSHVRPLPYALVYTGTAGSGGGTEVPGGQSGAKGRDQEAGRGPEDMLGAGGGSQ